MLSYAKNNQSQIIERKLSSRAGFWRKAKDDSNIKKG